MRGIAVVALLLVALAGCSSTSERDRVDPKVEGSQAHVRVVVVDNHSDRVADALVILQKAGRAGNTDANGIYVEKDVPPGNETVVVNAQGYTDGRRAFVVRPGQTNEVIVFVDKIPGGRKA